MSASIKAGGKQLDQNAIPTTSLADMMFLLLIFFIMTSTLARTTGFVTDAPSPSKTATPTADKTPTISVHDGRITIDDRTVSLAELRKTITDMHLEQRSDAGKIIILEATGNVTYQQYYEVLALIKTSGGVAAISGESTGQK